MSVEFRPLKTRGLSDDEIERRIIIIEKYPKLMDTIEYGHYRSVLDRRRAARQGIDAQNITWIQRWRMIK